MKRIYALLIVILAALAFPVSGGASVADDEGAPVCYGYGIVGYDMVVNARLGMAPDAAVGLATRPAPAGGRQHYSVPILQVVLGAFGWRGGPEDYATAVMDHCMQQSGGAAFVR